MKQPERMSYKEIASQLRSLAKDRKSFFHQDGDDEIFRKDYRACMQAARIIEALAEPEKDGASNDGRCYIRPGDEVVCIESGVKGVAVRTYKPTACELQLLVRTSDGRQYNAPFSTWVREGDLWDRVNGRQQRQPTGSGEMGVICSHDPLETRLQARRASEKRMKGCGGRRSHEL